jgi:hypothetical protein
LESFDSLLPKNFPLDNEFKVKGMYYPMWFLNWNRGLRNLFLKEEIGRFVTTTMEQAMQNMRVKSANSAMILDMISNFKESQAVKEYISLFKSIKPTDIGDSALAAVTTFFIMVYVLNYTNDEMLESLLFYRFLDFFKVYDSFVRNGIFCSQITKLEYRCKRIFGAITDEDSGIVINLLTEKKQMQPISTDVIKQGKDLKNTVEKLNAKSVKITISDMGVSFTKQKLT